MIFFKREELPDLRTTTLDEIQAIRIGPDHQLHRELTQGAVAVATDQAIQCRSNLVELYAYAVLNRQVKEQMAVHDVGVGFALTAPRAC